MSASRDEHPVATILLREPHDVPQVDPSVIQHNVSGDVLHGGRTFAHLVFSVGQNHGATLHHGLPVNGVLIRVRLVAELPLLTSWGMEQWFHWKIRPFPRSSCRHACHQRRAGDLPCRTNHPGGEPPSSSLESWPEIMQNYVRSQIHSFLMTLYIYVLFYFYLFFFNLLFGLSFFFLFCLTKNRVNRKKKTLRNGRVSAMVEGSSRSPETLLSELST